MRDLIYGKGNIDRIVSIEIVNDKVVVYRELEDGSIDLQTYPMRYWILFHKSLSPKFKRLKGDLHFKYLMEYEDSKKWKEVIRNSRTKGYDHWVVRSAKDQYMIREGQTYFRDMRPEEVSVMSFDLETTGVTHDKNSKVLLISTTFRKLGQVTKRLFSLDEYETQKEMIDDWCKYVREMDPSILVGHNVYGFDFPYLVYCAKQAGTSVRLGRDDTNVIVNTYPSKFRKDGSQDYDFNNVSIHGREIVDTFFLAIKYDVARKYPSYKLKEIIEFEGLQKKDRQFYDASKIAKNWHIESERSKIKAYAIDDSDDALALYDLMIPSYFYYAQSIPRPFQGIINTATGSQINAFLVRAYLQQGHSLPQTSQVREYEGGISFGNPGIYKNVLKVDVASLYPSIMREYRVHDKHKDPQGLFLKTVDYFTEERLKNKQLGKETGERHYKDLEQAQKIVINSMYGFLGSTGLIFNSPENASFVTRKGREILETGIKWAEGRGFQIVNADTDSFSYTTGSKVSESDFAEQIAELNTNFPEMIRWEDDGIYKTVIVVKAKNYVLEDMKGKVKIKGSGLKATMKEPALQRFMKETIEVLLKGRKDHVIHLYQSYARQIDHITDISDWCSKSTVTKAVLNPGRTQEQRVLDALKGTNVQEGDKIYLFFKTSTEYCLRERFDGEYEKSSLFKKLYNSLKVFSNLLDMDMVPDYSLKRNQHLLEIYDDCSNIKSMEVA